MKCLQLNLKKNKIKWQGINHPAFLLRCLQLGIPLSELGDVTVGEIIDTFIERSNDDIEYDEVEILDGNEALKFLGVN